MARFIRDEKRTYPLAWLTIGGIFAAATVWAVYAEFVTRVPWQKHQQAYFEMELEQSEQGLSRSKGEWDKEIEPALSEKIARRTALQENVASGDYSQAAKRLIELNAALRFGRGGEDLQRQRSRRVVLLPQSRRVPARQGDERGP